MDIQNLLKVYNIVNDEKKPKVNMKFVMGALIAFIGIVAIAGIFLFKPAGHAPPETAPAQQSREYVGYSPAEVQQLGILDPAVPQERLDAWKDAHPDRAIDTVESDMRDGILVGYWVTSHPR